MVRRLTVKVVPKSRQPGVASAADGSLVVRVRSAPEKGRANDEVLDRLADYLRLPKARLTIVLGGASRRKVVEISED